MSSLRARMMVAMGAVVLTVLAIVGSLGNRMASNQMHRYVDEESVRRAEATAGRMRQPLEEYFRTHRSWVGVEGLLMELLPVTSDAAMLVFDQELRFAAGTEPHLAGIEAHRLADGMLHLSKDTGPGKSGGGVIKLVVGSGQTTLDDGMSGTAGTLVVLPGLRGLGGKESPKKAPSIREQMMVMVGISGLAALLATWWLTGRLLAPVSELTEAAQEMATGRLDRRVAVRSSDEIGRLSAAYNAMADEIERNEKLRRTLVSDVAHELRTPLTGIRCQLEAMQDGIVKPESKIWDSLHEDVIALQCLVDDLQDLAVGDCGEMVLQLRRIDLREEIERVSRNLVADVGSSIEVVIPSLPAVLADRQRLQQILLNLLDNAVQHAGFGTPIRIAALLVDGMVEVSVEDSGPGIPAEHLDLVFERFYRVDPSRTRQSGGSGLGLAIARQLVQAHGGTIRAESPPGGGARFVFNLPVAENQGTRYGCR